MIKAIVFDFFGVIKSDEYLYWLHKHGLTRTGKFADASEANDTDKVSIDGFFALLEQDTGIDRTDIAIEFAQNNRMNPELIELIASLKKRYKIGLLSNSNSSHLKQILIENHLIDLFDVIVISGEVGFVKPEPQIFQYLITELQFAPDEIIFVDDATENIDAAKHMGIHAIKYVSVKDLYLKLIEDKVIY